MKKIFKGIGTIFILICVMFTLTVAPLLVSGGMSTLKLFNIIHHIQKDFLFEYDTTALIDGALDGMVDALDDKYSDYMDITEATDLKESNMGVFGGIGISVSTNENQECVVVKVLPNTPGEKVGILSDDIIKEVDGQSVEGLSLDNTVALMRGEVGTKVTIGVKRENTDELIRYEITRDYIEEVSVVSDVIKDHEEIGYIRIEKFADNTDELFVKELNALIDRGIKGLIIDLRNNLGGSVDAACNIANLFVPKGDIVHIAYKNGEDVFIEAKGAQFHAPVVVLVNQYSASASEIMVGALQDTESATIVGTTTHGKGVVQKIYYMNDGSGLKLTVAKYMTPNGNDIHEVGIEPDIYVELKESDTTDVQCEVAIELMLQKLK